MTTDPRDALERALMKVAHERLRPWWRRPQVGLLTIGLVAVAAPATAAISGVWSPDPSRRAPIITTTSVSGACASTEAPENPTSSAAIPDALGRRFSVLRRTPTAEDEPDLRSSVYAGRVKGAARRVGVNTDGAPYYLVPILSRDRANTVPADCLDALSPEMRAAAEASNAKIRSGPPTWKLCLVAPTGAGCSTETHGQIDAVTLQTGVARGGAETGLSDIAGVVPNDVRTVRVSYGDGSQKELTVDDNLYIYRVKLTLSTGPAEVTWLDGNGDVVPQPRP